MSKTRTQQMIRDVLAKSVAATQEDIRTALKRKGVEITQASVSRALARIGAVKTRRVDGQITYHIPAMNQPAQNKLLPELVTDIVKTDTLVIIQTRADSAKLVAQVLDDARVEGVAGTLAGEYTIFVAPHKAGDLGKIYQKLQQIFLKD